MDDILIRREGRAGRITLNRPAALNALTYAMCLEIDRALITCNADNEGSKATIIACGGVLDAQLPTVRNAEGVEELRFWVPTGRAS